jgi:hypothetical protein
VRGYVPAVLPCLTWELDNEAHRKKRHFFFLLPLPR